MNDKGDMHPERMIEIIIHKVENGFSIVVSESLSNLSTIGPSKKYVFETHEAMLSFLCEYFTEK